MKKSEVINELTRLIEPVILNMNYELYNLNFIKENRENYLRIYIDRDEGISLEDCEKVSRRISELLDEKDPIEEAYYLEVSSPGMERELFTDKHLKKYLESKIIIKMASLFKGAKNFEGSLKKFDDKNIFIETDEKKEICVPRDKISKINLKVEF